MLSSSQRRFRPTIETLPARDLPAVTAALDAGDPGILVVTGDIFSNSVQICQSDAANQIVVKSLKGPPLLWNFASAPIHTIRVSLSSGADQFHYALMDDLVHGKLVVVDPGGGNDDIYATTTEATIRENLTLQIGVRDGENRGDDNAVLLFGNVDDALLHVDADFGLGNDSFAVRFNSYDWASKMVSDATLFGTARAFIDVRGGDGKDSIYHFGTFEFETELGKVQTSMHIQSLAQLRLDFNGGAGDDYIAVYHRGSLQGLMEVDAHGATGEDFLYGDIEIVDSFTVSDGELDLNFYGDGDNDMLGLRVDTVPTIQFTDGEPPFIDGGGGIDENLGVTANVDLWNMEA